MVYDDVSIGTMALQPRRRVVVTGVGAVTPLGLTFVDSWKALLAGRSGAVSLTQALRAQYPPRDSRDDSSQVLLEQELELAATLSCQVAAPVQNFEPTLLGKNGNNRTTSRFVQLALQAASEAIAQAGLSKSNEATTTIDKQRTGVSIGSGMSGVREIVKAAQTVEASSFRKLNPHFVPKVLTNSAAARVSLEFGLQGPNFSASTACAAGSHAIGDAARCIATGMADIMLAGGSESCIDPLSLAGFGRLRALSSNFNDEPERASRPFDSERDGFVMGEGACVLVLEELEHAIQRRLTSDGSSTTSMPEYWVELVGYGVSGDAFHITSPDPAGQGAVRAMRMAIQDASSLDLDATTPVVQYVNAHATSTPKGDEIEARAIHEAICGDTASSSRQKDDPVVKVSSTKGSLGHLLGAAGAIEAAFTVQSLLAQTVPPTRNLEQIEPGAVLPGLVYVRGEPMHCDDADDYNVAMSNSFGFGGTNSSLLFQRIKL